MSHRILLYLFLILVMVMPACTTQGGAQKSDRTLDRHSKAFEVIQKNLKAVGGAEKIRAIHTLALQGSTGSALLPSGQDITVYCKKPHLMKQEGLFWVTLCNGKQYIFNNGAEEVPLSGASLDEIKYRIGFYHNCFTLLKWEHLFPRAELVDIKQYGPTEQYMIRLPEGENGQDLTVYIDTKTFLIDRIVYRISHPEARELQVVNSLREYKDFHGIQVPTRVLFDKIGWEESPTHFLIKDVSINPPFDSTLFENADIDFGAVTCEGDSIQGEVRGEMDSFILTNIRLEDLFSIGIELKDWLDLRVGDICIRVKVLDNIQRSASEIKPGEIYLCRYPISGYTRLMLMDLAGETQAKIPCKEGDILTLAKIHEEESFEENKNP